MKRSKSVKFLKKYMDLINNSDLIPFRIKLNVIYGRLDKGIARAHFYDGKPNIDVFIDELPKLYREEPHLTCRESLKALLTHECAHIIDMVRLYQLEGRNPMTDISYLYEGHRESWANDYRILSKCVFNIEPQKLEADIEYCRRWDRSLNWRRIVEGGRR